MEPHPAAELVKCQEKFKSGAFSNNINSARLQMFENLNVEAFARMIITNNSRFENSENRIVFCCFSSLILEAYSFLSFKNSRHEINFSIYAIASYPLLCF